MLDVIVKVRLLPLTSILWGYLEHASVFEYAAIEVFHDVERGTNYRAIRAEYDRFWYRYLLLCRSRGINIMLMERTEHVIFAIYSVSCWRKQLSSRLLS